MAKVRAGYQKSIYVSAIDWEDFQRNLKSIDRSLILMGDGKQGDNKIILRAVAELARRLEAKVKKDITHD